MGEQPEGLAVRGEGNEAQVVVPTATPQVAPPPPAKPAYPFSVMSVLSTAMRVTKRNFAAFIVLACVLKAPSIVVELTLGKDNVLLALILQMITNSLTAAVVAYGVIMELYGSRPSARACIAKGFSQLGRVLGVSLVSTLVILASMVLFVVPGFIVALMFFVIVPITVVEKVGIDAAMKRSRELTQGRKGDLFLILLLGAGAGVAIELSAQSELGPNAAFLWRHVGSALTTMYFSVTTAVVYVVLRQLREGTKVPELATAFARIQK